MQCKHKAFFSLDANAVVSQVLNVVSNEPAAWTLAQADVKAVFSKLLPSLSRVYLLHHRNHDSVQRSEVTPDSASSLIHRRMR